jgi:alpha-L-fucosidase 2
MKKKINFRIKIKKLICLCFIIAQVMVSKSQSNEKSAISMLKLKVNWPEFLSRHDMVWEKMPEDYYEGAFVGNGLMGAIIFRDDKEPNSLRFEIGRTDIYDERKDSDVHARCRLPIGQVLLTTAGKITGTKMRIDLWNAEVRGEITTDVGSIGFRCFAPSDEMIVLIELTTTNLEKNCRLTFRPQQGNSPRRMLFPTESSYSPNPPFQLGSVDGFDVCVQPLLAGGDYATAWKEERTVPNKRVYYIHVANGIPAGGAAIKAVKALNHAMKREIRDIEKAHRAWWHAFYPKSFVTIPDARIESFYWIQWYKLASAMREGGPMVDLMGPWFRVSRWAAYWMNLNAQLSLYTVHQGNHLELGEPMCQWLENSMEDLINNAPPEYRYNSASLGNPTNLRLIAPAPGSSKFQFVALPWLVQHHYLQYRYTIDDQRLLEKIYPLMRRTFNLYLHYLERGDDDRYHIPLAYSDEYGYAEDTNLNIGLLRWGLETLIKCNARLRINDPMLPEWKETLAKLVDYQIDKKTGLMIGKDTLFAKPHRHYSHLLAIFPLYVLNVEQYPEYREIIETSIRHFDDLNVNNTIMYRFTGASSLFAAIGKGDEALGCLDRSLTIYPNGPTLRENTLYSEGGSPTFESPISAARSVLDMLIQSWGGTIRVFPACPSNWKDISFHDLRAEGAFLVSASREAGKTKFIRIRSLAGEPCIIKCDMKEDNIKLIAPKTVTMKINKEKIVLENLKKGEEAILYSGDKPDKFIVKPLPSNKNDHNQWGGRR